ncbi:MAG: PQQ-dependent sugar dehydrogenase [Gemmatimonadota bacterium]|nr:PQQ-dependent sugar dehydrogenase [Gemmatimonadota bacterium]MDH4350182.1 PQQ-dependent sugar dehydrogenase [Gemmatimonadota bacterium]MDH5198250.1 PQQ-dependent sugar dehydrogenase [Gemmatimonadota bacterium]
METGGRRNGSKERQDGRTAKFAALLPLLLASPAVAQGPVCAADNAGLTLPDGFCAVVVAADLGRARHLAVAPNGDIVVAVPARDSGGVLVLRDVDGDGVADVRRQLIRDPSAADVQLRVAGGRSWLYYGTYHEIIRYPWTPGMDDVAGRGDTVVRELPGGRQHGIKTFVITDDGRLFVNLGAPSNACQTAEREAGSIGMDPCPLLDTTGGIWLFDADRVGQSGRDGERWATGLRNTVALAVNPADRELYAAVHGRDQLGQLWGYSDSASAEKPAEEFVRVTRGINVGWPYCYFDPELGRKVLAPEYGGDGRAVERCAGMTAPLIAFPAHWAPDGLEFYTGSQFPTAYRGGAFLAFHGSWNRAPLPQQGFKIVFIPFDGATPGTWRVFADGFQDVEGRPVDVAQAPDGSLVVSDDRGGRVYRILYRGTR